MGHTLIFKTFRLENLMLVNITLRQYVSRQNENEILVQDLVVVSTKVMSHPQRQEVVIQTDRLHL